MRCPFCNHGDSRVVDSRTVREGMAIRRRRECESCQERFTTYESLDAAQPTVVKKSGGRERFDRDKLVAGIVRACEKRDVSTEDIDIFADRLLADLLASGHREIPSRKIGEDVISFLREQDPVAYVRYASVYRSFQDAGDFVDTVRDLEERPPGEAGKQLSLLDAPGTGKR